ncbi:hypothetical protein [Streptomyces sp. NPDC045251]|uniref:hypothetical protein n=1 Tax=unclassified Streptomyces TaxID=2593676 RepID=UPI0033E21720
MSRNFAFGASALICFSISLMPGRTMVLKIPGMASARGLPTYLVSLPSTWESVSPLSNVLSAQLPSPIANRRFLNDVGEAYVVAADADGDEGGVLAEVSLLDLP